MKNLNELVDELGIDSYESILDIAKTDGITIYKVVLVKRNSTYIYNFFTMESAKDKIRQLYKSMVAYADRRTRREFIHGIDDDERGAYLSIIEDGYTETIQQEAEIREDYIS